MGTAGGRRCLGLVVEADGSPTLGADDYRRILAVLEAAQSAESLEGVRAPLLAAVEVELGCSGGRLILAGPPRDHVRAAGGVFWVTGAQELEELAGFSVEGTEAPVEPGLLIWFDTHLPLQCYLSLPAPAGGSFSSLQVARLRVIRPHLASVLRSRLAVREAAGWKLLSGREAEVAGLVARGWSNREIASQLGIGEDTVKKHLWHCFHKLGVRSRSQLAALREG